MDHDPALLCPLGEEFGVRRAVRPGDGDSLRLGIALAHVPAVQDPLPVDTVLDALLMEDLVQMLGAQIVVCRNLGDGDGPGAAEDRVNVLPQGLELGDGLPLPFVIRLKGQLLLLRVRQGP